MACACKKNSARNAMIHRSRTGSVIRPTTGPVSATGGPAAAPTPTALRAAVPTVQRSFAGDLQEKKKTQRVRRDAIRRALNK